MLDSTLWLLYLWAAGFASAAFVLETAWRSAQAVKPGRFNFRRLAVEVITIAFWGGLFAWAIYGMKPELVNGKPALLAVVSAALGRLGLTGSRDAVLKLAEERFGIKFEKPRRREDDD